MTGAGGGGELEPAKGHSEGSDGSTTTPAQRAAEAERLMTLLYDELRALASRHMSREPGGHTLQATALVHEAYLRLARDRE